MEGSPGTAASLAPSLPCLYSVSVSCETNWCVWCLSVSLSLQLGDLIPLPMNLLLNDEAQPGSGRKYGLKLVALNQPHTGNFGGVYIADKMCYEQAKAMGLSAYYRAFLSSPKPRAVNKDLVPQKFRESYPVTNLRGDILFSNYKSIFTGGGGKFPPNIPIYSFDGRDVLADPFWSVKQTDVQFLRHRALWLCGHAHPQLILFQSLKSEG
uniref:Collagenase NC10/endostatin domain-containing protein n=1 Tax=Oncorhynchus kisutch TaxID=8019 RepID=A0A8C7ISY4_ONCKI